MVITRCTAFPLAVFLLGLCMAGTLSAQSINSSYSGYHHASTAAEGAARGAADLVRAAGDANLRNSLAAINLEQARSLNVDNRLKATDAYFAMRARNKEARAAERGPRPTSEQLFRINQAKLPQRLSPGELDPLSGQVNWPLALRDARFESDRKRMEAMIVYWAQHHGSLTSQQYQEIVKTGNQLKTDLSEVIRSIPSKDYIASKNFLRSLVFTVRSAT